MSGFVALPRRAGRHCLRCETVPAGRGRGRRVIHSPQGACEIEAFADLKIVARNGRLGHSATAKHIAHLHRPWHATLRQSTLPQSRLSNSTTSDEALSQTLALNFRADRVNILLWFYG
jgi:hypothetical protein